MDFYAADSGALAGRWSWWGWLDAGEGWLGLKAGWV